MASGFVIRASFVLGSLGISSLRRTHCTTIGQRFFGINVPSGMICALCSVCGSAALDDRRLRCFIRRQIVRGTRLFPELFFLFPFPGELFLTFFKVVIRFSHLHSFLIRFEDPSTSDGRPSHQSAQKIETEIEIQIEIGIGIDPQRLGGRRLQASGDKNDLPLSASAPPREKFFYFVPGRVLPQGRRGAEGRLEEAAERMEHGAGSAG